VRLIASFADVPPEEAGLEAAAPPPYDAVLEVWLDGAAADGIHEIGAASAPLLDAAHTYHVREVVQKEYQRTWKDGARSPGIKRVVPVTRASGIDPDQFAAHWHERHGPLALKHHIGMSKYVQNVVLAATPEDAPAFDGIAELHFPTAADLRERSIDSPEGQAIISADVARFVGGAVSLFCSEYVLKARV
jgi:uncharacterized protein (TIGR02118 family)